ncbi:putative Peptidoglycan/LPS O-acetylase OafA/YrhL, contains acyltransferase and SGNH-hydrolase domains [Beijerinckiaceae bacterium RH AL1]|nr:acyltransferase family protein [Beijerinckiaceae bacterium]VVB48695.1 putative Peptidoglycan/LPS O-acetylase OafA/YrhL, contains acyltransferase and SGNH-hydrolase domains [Beijerinckiaceae bacterium RH CH11]VVB48776.1 putative Peptidoglycan/LPS O-acetylase OafA/YrhL, contains acyltransferase and SGNH-hydrolase domains [Beijerinckiaceae bacterium RH AL8]VVC56522.1 putative Peptidoglycan/LPS O-acetylase OafA/YrhL, contains acyltransferase and SGNH-hydrolase domains [Beijerinckiaceae bacterium 
MHFRDDINGLRAIAVTAVVLYHFALGVAPGGFVGVDVFFVISGFLMAQIVLGRLERGRFSLTDFYLARVRRIVPAMTVLVAATLAVGLVVMNPLRLEDLAGSALASLLFYSNLAYAHQTGYFAAPPEDNWLIHTWSLSVEWQFYVVYPVALMLLARLGLRARGTGLAMAAVAVASLALTILNWRTGGSRLDQGFFLLQSRAWEFLAGGLVAALGARVRLTDGARIWLHAIGLTLIAAAVAAVDRNSAWPSPMTLVPVVGTALVLLAARERAWWARLAPVAALGRWSYSIYLWHWPIVAILAFEGLATKAWALAGIALSIACGAASFTLVETRLTTRLWERARLGRPLGGLVFAGVAGLALFASATQSLEAIRFGDRPALLAQLVDDRAAQADWAFPKACDRRSWDAAIDATHCSFGEAAPPGTLVIGDSFAEQLAPRFAHPAADNALAGKAVAFLTKGGCPPIPDVDRRAPGYHCPRVVEALYQAAAASPATRIVVAADWPAYGRKELCVGPGGACTSLDKAGFQAALDAAYARMAERWRALREAGKEVVVLDVPPFGNGNPTRLYALAAAGRPVGTLSRPLADFKAETGETSKRLAEAARAAGVEYVDPAPALCPDGQCPIVVDGRTLYKDDVHLRASILKSPRFAIYDALIVPGSARSASAAGR